jgi:hypothetical protein
MKVHAQKIVFLSVPESLRGQIQASLEHTHECGDEHEEPEFSIDPAIPLPVELPPDETRLNIEELSWEMILSGMIRVLADDPDGEHAG